jgi:hypothetical protein
LIGERLDESYLLFIERLWLTSRGDNFAGSS